MNTIPKRRAAAHSSEASTRPVMQGRRANLPEGDPRNIGLAAGAIVTLGLLVIAWRLTESQATIANLGAASNTLAPSEQEHRSVNESSSNVENGNLTPRHSATVAPPLPAPKSIIGSSGLDAFERPLVDKFTSQQLQMVGPGFQRGLQATTQNAPEADNWYGQYTAKNRIRIERGDLLQATFYARCGSNHCKSEFVFETSPTGQRAVAKVFEPESTWMKCVIAFMADKDVAPDEGRALLRLGYAEQTIQFGGIEIVNYGPGLSILQLTATACNAVGASE